MNQSGELNIYNSTGQLVLSYQLPAFSSSQYLNLTNISAGIYSCVLTSQGQRVVKILVVMFAGVRPPPRFLLQRMSERWVFLRWGCSLPQLPYPESILVLKRL
ncbi:MAG: T9SS type A sorting domain-containing protein [Bacteroidetes bacterium]|nr:T9SS type A sorting domain-containing protein [Bacteroidota bacterium]